MQLLAHNVLTRPSSLYNSPSDATGFVPMPRRIGHRRRTPMSAGLKARPRTPQLFGYAPSTPRRLLPRSWTEIPFHGASCASAPGHAPSTASYSFWPHGRSPPGAFRVGAACPRDISLARRRASELAARSMAGIDTHRSGRFPATSDRVGPLDLPLLLILNELLE